jgi:intein/homing endonuclease
MTDLIEKIRIDPYNFIKDYYEKIYMHMGKEVFSILSLVIPSLILPPIPHEHAREIKPSINFLLIAPPGCLDGETYICLSDGSFKKIKSFGKEHLQKINKFIMINPTKKDGCKYQSKAEVFHKYDNQKCFKIKLNSGREIIVSELHPLMTDKGWVKCRELKVGDSLRILHKIRCSKKDYEIFPEFKLSKNSKKIKIPLCNEDVALLLGYGIGDGSSRKYKTQFCINDEEKDIIPILIDKIYKNFNIIPKVYERDLSKYKTKINGREIKRTQNLFYLEVDSIGFSNIFEVIIKKRVPEIIMSSKKSVVSNFLEGLFEADGCCRIRKKRNELRGEICLKSSENKLLQDVLLLLLKFGIKARIDKDNLSIAKTDDLIKFYKQIGFLSKKKINKLSFIINLIKPLERKRHLNNKYIEKIKSIEELPKQTVYDIEVPEVKRYIANGIISHNTAKSSIAETFEKLAYNSFPFEYITDAKFYEVMSQKDFVSVVVGDVFKIFSDKMLNKTMENVLGDEQKISRMTKRTDSHEKKIKAVAFLAGTPNSLTTVISDGMIFRTAVCLIFHDPMEHEKIGEFVGNGAFNEHKGEDEEIAIEQFYKELLEIQLDRHPNISPIEGYVVKQEYKQQIIDTWKPLVKPITRRTKFSFFRELHQGFRYMVAHAFLNIYNREIKENKIVINQDDVNVAIELMKNELNTKFEVLSCSKVVSEEKMKTTKDLSEYVEKLKRNKINIKDTSTNIMGSLIGK